MNSSSTELYLSRMHWPVSTLGHGHRIGIWFQGCSIGCKGCCSRDTWLAKPEHRSTVEAVLGWIESQPLEQVDGFTLSGGEPFEQPQTLAQLLASLRQLPERRDGQQRDLLLYSGFTWSRLQRDHKPVLALADAVISEPFLSSRPDGRMAGSDNQAVHLISTLGQSRYGSDRAVQPAPRALQLHHDGQQLWLIGIPRRGDLEMLQRQARNKGVALDLCSWVA